MKLEDSDILVGITKGDKRLFDLVFKSYYSGLLTFAKDCLRSKEAAQEVIQDMFLYIWENHEKIQIKTSLKAYLYRSVHNRCMNYFRDSVSDLHRNIQIDQLKNQIDLLLVELPDSFFDESFTEQVELELDETVESLPEQCKKIFRLNRYENLSYPEIAKKLNISLSTVKTQMSRAMHTIHQKMKKYL